MFLAVDVHMRLLTNINPAFMGSRLHQVKVVNSQVTPKAAKKCR